MASSLQSILAGFGDLLGAIGDGLATESSITDGLALLGWLPPPDIDLVTAFALDTSDLVAALEQLANAGGAELNDESKMAALYAAVLATVATQLPKVAAMATQVDQALTLAGGAAAQYATTTNIGTELPGRLLDYLIVGGVMGAAPTLGATLFLLGVFDTQSVAEDAPNYVSAHEQVSVDYSRFGKLLTHPGATIASQYGWGTAAFDAETVLDRIGLVLRGAGARSVLTTMSAAVEQRIQNAPTATDTAATPQLLVELARSAGPVSVEVLASLHRRRPTAADGSDTGLEFALFARGQATASVPLIDPVTLVIDAQADLEEGVGIVIRPTGASVRGGLVSGNLQDLTGQVSVGVEAGTDAGDPIQLVAIDGGTSLTFQVAYVTVGVATPDLTDLTITAGFRGAQLTIGTGGDSFLSTVLPPSLLAKFDIGLLWSKVNGLTVQGSGSLTLNIPLNVALGPIELDQCSVALGADASGNVQVTIGLTGGFAIGPIAATVQNIGAQASLGQSDTGNLGRAQLDLGFKFPDGVGLAIDAGVATGGGFIECDAAKGQYAGVLELALESLSLTAIGLIQTKMADGTPLPGGYSFLVIISVEFVPFVELGFGFSLNGVGGYFGYNRTINADALRAGVHSGELNDIMFPVDPVGHAPQLIQELGGFFPPAPGRFLIGPMVQIQWGSPLPILTADLGVILELPAPVRIAILGVLQVGLPQAGDDAVILLNLDVLGLIDFGLGTLSLDASLYGSRIAEFPVTGDMALRLGWKAEREFIVSFGGCHPAQQLPPGFPTLNRLGICLSDSDEFVFTLQAYLAATSNTLQFGASAHLLAQISDARVDGMVSFDALIHKNPFGVQIDFAAAVTVWIDGQQLLAVNISGQVTGPAPWQFSGQASVNMFFVSVTVSCHLQLGSAPPPPPPAPVSVIGLLAADVQNTVNWSALPAPGDTVVTLTPAPPSGTDMRAHPLASLTFHQHTVPLATTIDVFGSADVAGPTKLALTSITYADSAVAPATVTPVQDAFAPGQFRKLSDSDALSLPAFATYQAGVAFTPTAPDLDDRAVGDAAAVSYAIDLIDAQGQLPSVPLPPLDAQAATRLIPSSAAARAPTRTTGPRRYQGTPGTITVSPRTPAGSEAP
jgi:hypothetical protein